MKDRIRFLEEIASNGHPALNIMQYDGWLLRFSEGVTGRANSVSPLYPPQEPLEEKVAYCEACYAKQGLPALFKVSDCDTELAGYLAGRGYTVVTPTDVMVLDMEQADPAGDPAGCVFDTKPDAWLAPYFAFEKRTDPHTQDVYRRIMDRVAVDTIYCTLLRDGQPAACASVALEQGWALLQNVVVDPGQRGLGLGEKLCRALLAKAKGQGARYAYLQVVQGNNIALNLYRKMGFKKLYTYCYMKQP